MAGQGRAGGGPPSPPARPPSPPAAEPRPGPAPTTPCCGAPPRARLLAGLGGARGPGGGAALPDLFRSRGRSESPPSARPDPRSPPGPRSLRAACRAPACWPRCAARCSAPPASSRPPVSARAARAPPLGAEVRRGAPPPPPLWTDSGAEPPRGRGAASPAAPPPAAAVRPASPAVCAPGPVWGGESGRGVRRWLGTQGDSPALPGEAASA